MTLLQPPTRWFSSFPFKLKILLCGLCFMTILIVVFRIGQYSSEAKSMQRAIQLYGNHNYSATQEALSWSPRVFLTRNFLSHEECDYIIALGEHKLSRSTVIGENGKSVVDNYRTSDGVFFAREAKDPVLQHIEQRIAVWSHIPAENGEVFYLLRYKEGQEYKPHTDWFLFDDEKHDFFRNQGNRIATVLLYLSDVEEGGETYFPKANLDIKPRKGDAILFWNLNPDNLPDLRSIHGGRPVIDGTKWCMTKWIRQKRANR